VEPRALIAGTKVGCRGVTPGPFGSSRLFYGEIMAAWFWEVGDTIRASGIMITPAR